MRTLNYQRVQTAFPQSDLPAVELSEQFDGTTGYEKSVRDLTWSYAAFLAAARAKTGQSVLGRAAAAAIPNQPGPRHRPGKPRSEAHIS